jgi:3-keto-disaccharide hydrolase
MIARCVPTLTLVSSGFVLLTLFNSAVADEAKVPTEVIRPFDQKDLRSFSTWLKKSGREDPEHVFRLENGVLRCGDEDLGYVATREAYRDFHLSVEYRWGWKNPNDKYVRNSGVLLHGVGPDGSQNGVWMTSIECQLAQGCEGDLILIKGKSADGSPYPATITSTTRVAEDGKTRWEKEGQPTVYSGRQLWWSKHQPHFKELIDTRGQNDVASPLGEWTRVECLCQGSRITIKINGETVNECFDANPAAGKILLQSEGHEVFFRNLELRPLSAVPKN